MDKETRTIIRVVLIRLLSVANLIVTTQASVEKLLVGDHGAVGETRIAVANNVGCLHISSDGHFCDLE
jgi:hypothetical protein